MNKTMPLVSVIIPIYRAENYLTKCLNSVIGQTYRNLEIILVDDGSPDNCGKICDEFADSDSRIKVIHKENSGVSSARNIGIEASNGEWIYFMDSDDIIEKDLIDLALNTALQDRTDMCFFDYAEFGENVSKQISALKSDGTIFKNIDCLETFIIYSSGFGSVCFFIIKSEIIKNKIKFDETVNFSEDELFKVQVYGQINSYSYLHKVLYHYRISSLSACGMVLARKDYSKERLNIYNKMLDMIDNGNYPDNAIIVPNTRLISQISEIVRIAFQDRFSIKCNYSMIEGFINTEEYKEAKCNYDKKTVLGPTNLPYAVLKKPNRLVITIIYLLVKVSKKIKRCKFIGKVAAI